MSTDERYDEATVRLVAEVLQGWNAGGKAAETVLTALADAGLLLPPDAEENRQYGRRMPNGMILASPNPEPTHYRLLGPWTEVPQ